MLTIKNNDGREKKLEVKRCKKELKIKKKDLSILQSK